MILVGLLVGTVLGSRTPILTYHDIIPQRTSSSLWFDCTIKEFQEQIAWFKRQGANFVSLGQVETALSQQRPLPKNAVCITFADNYLGFYKYAWPIIKRERIPVAQFVHTGFVGATTGRPKMSWLQLIELDRSGLVTIASQTVTHPPDLTKMAPAQVLQEFAQSKNVLEKKLGHRVTQLAYPNGKFNSRVSELARKAGYRIAFTEECRPAESGRNLFEVPRYVHTKYRQAWKSKS